MDDPSHGGPFLPPPPRLSGLQPIAEAHPFVGELPAPDHALDAAFASFHLSFPHHYHPQQQQQPSPALYGASSSLHTRHALALSALRSSELLSDPHFPFQSSSSPSPHHRLLQAQHAAAGFEGLLPEDCFSSFPGASPSRWTTFPVEDVGGIPRADRFHQPCVACLEEALRNRQGADGRDGAVGFLIGVDALLPLDVFPGRNARTRGGHGDSWRNGGEVGRFLPAVPDGNHKAERRSGNGDARDGVHRHLADSWRVSTVERSQKYSSMEEVWGDVVGAAKDHGGSKLFSEILKWAKEEEVSALFLKVKDHALDLMVDVYGSVTFQSLMELCDGEQRMCVLQVVTRDGSEFFRICCHTYGARTVQKLVQLAETEEISLLASAMGPKVVQLAMDPSGHHVLQDALREFPHGYKQLLVDPVADNLLEIATDKSGCCIAQQCLDLVDYRERFLEKIAEDALVLAQDPYGNFVVQHVLDKRSVSATGKILKQLKGNHVMLSLQKFGSNVVEKCLKEATDISCIEIIVQELISSPKIEDVLKDRFGNYVIQTALQVSLAQASHVYVQLINLIYKYLPSLHNHIYGKRIIERINTWKGDHIYALHDQKQMKANSK